MWCLTSWFSLFQSKSTVLADLWWEWPEVAAFAGFGAEAGRVQKRKGRDPLRWDTETIAHLTHVPTCLHTQASFFPPLLFRPPPPSMSLTAKKVQSLYDSLDAKDSEIYCQRAREMYSSEPLRTGLFVFSMQQTNLLAMFDPSMLGEEKLLAQLKDIDKNRCDFIGDPVLGLISTLSIQHCISIDHIWLRPPNLSTFTSCLGTKHSPLIG